MKGVLNFFSETGTEGGHWAFQDAKHIVDENNWSYDGLNVLQDGDQLTIYDKEDETKIVWSGVIKLNMCPLFSESVNGMWMHADQDGITRDIWAKWFFENYPAELNSWPFCVHVGK